MSMSTMNTPRLAFEASTLQVTGKATNSEKRMVKRLLDHNYQYTAVEKTIVFMWMQIPDSVSDELIGDKNKQVEALTKLWIKALAGPLRGYTDDEERLKKAREFFTSASGKSWMHEHFLPYPIKNVPSPAARLVLPERQDVATGAVTSLEAIASFTEHPVVKIVKDIVAPNMPPASAHVVAIDGTNVHFPSAGQAVQMATPAPTKYVLSPATTGLALRDERVRNDPVLNTICPQCGEIHSRLRGIMRMELKLSTLVVYILAGVGILVAAVLAQLRKGYPKV